MSSARVEGSADVVDVWRIPLGVPPGAVTALYGLLGQRERDRLGTRSRSRHWRTRVVANGALRCLLGAHLDEHPAGLRFGVGPYGKPYLSDHPTVQFNLSHSGELALVAISNGRAVGIDVEHERPGLAPTEFAARYFAPAEYTLVANAGAEAPHVWRRLWVRKEACVKAAGARAALGLSLPVAGPLGPRSVRDASDRLPGGWALCDVTVPAGYAACVALAGERGFQVRSHSWSAPDPVPSAVLELR